MHNQFNPFSRLNAVFIIICITFMNLAAANAASSNCYTAAPGTIGTEAPCLGMLIVDRAMLDAAIAEGSSSWNGTYDFKPTDAYGGNFDPDALKGNTYTFSNSPYNIFTGQVTDFSELFKNNAYFNEDIGYWDVSSVTDMSYSFYAAMSFDKPIGDWNVSSVVTMNTMFGQTDEFDQDIGGWDVSNVTNMSQMFHLALKFSKDIGGWDVSNVTNMSNMFNQAFSFDKSIANWNVSKVTNMFSMFYHATSFNQDLSKWNVSHIPTEPYFFDDGATSWLDQGWRPIWGAVQLANAPTNLVADVGGSQLTLSFTASTNIDLSTIIDYKYQINAGTWVSASVTSSPIEIPIGDLIQGETNSISIRAVTDAGDGNVSAPLAVTIEPEPIAAPTDISPKLLSNQLTISFTAPQPQNGEVILDYEYQIDDGAWISAGVAQSPIEILTDDLTTGEPNSISIRAVTDAGTGINSDPANVTVETEPEMATEPIAAPTNISPKLLGNQLTINFTAPQPQNGAAILDYEYQIDDGAWVSAGVAQSPIEILTDDLTTGEPNSISIRAVTDAGTGINSDPADVTIETEPEMALLPIAAPTDISSQVLGNQLTINFTAPQPHDSGVILDYEYQIDDGAWISAEATQSPIVISKGLEETKEYSIKIRAVTSSGAGLASAAFSIRLGTPKSVFEQEKLKVSDQIQEVTLLELRNKLLESNGFMASARSRLINSQRDGIDASSYRENIAFDIDGSAIISTSNSLIDGAFFGQSAALSGDFRKVTSGDFNIQRDSEGNSSGTLFGRYAWEKTGADTSLYGWFIGAEYSRSNINGSFTGAQKTFGVSTGGYFVSMLKDGLFLEGGLSVENKDHGISLNNGTLDLSDTYNSKSILAGLVLSGTSVIDETSEVWPEISLTTSVIKIGDIGFHGQAYGITDNNLVLDAGRITMTEISFAPKYRSALDGQTLSESRIIGSASPKIMCKRIRTNTRLDHHCGSGLAFEILGTSDDNRKHINAKLMIDHIGGMYSRSFSLGGELRF